MIEFILGAVAVVVVAAALYLRDPARRAKLWARLITSRAGGSGDDGAQ